MARRKSFGNPLSRMLGEVLDKVGPEVVDSVLDVVNGPSKDKKGSASSTAGSTDWHTRVEGTPRKRH
jgi:hypothetical protein